MRQARARRQRSIIKPPLDCRETLIESEMSIYRTTEAMTCHTRHIRQSATESLSKMHRSVAKMSPCHRGKISYPTWTWFINIFNVFSCQLNIYFLCMAGSLWFWLALKRLITRWRLHRRWPKRWLPLLVGKPKAKPDALNRISPHLYLESEIVHALMDADSRPPEGGKIEMFQSSEPDMIMVILSWCFTLIACNGWVASEPSGKVLSRSQIFISCVNSLEPWK